MNLENINERSPAKKATYYMTSFIWYTQNRQIHRQKQISGFLGWEDGQREKGLTNNRYEGSFGGTKIF